MTDNEVSEHAADAEQKKPFLYGRVVWVGGYKSIIIEKNRLGLFERYSVLASVLRILLLIPLKPHLSHPLHCNYNVCVQSKVIYWISSVRTPQLLFAEVGFLYARVVG